MNRILIPLVLPVLLAACAAPTGTRPAEAHLSAPDELVAFSSHGAGAPPAAWAPLVILRNKKPTDYRLITYGGKTVLHAQARQAASGLMHHTSIDPFAQPWIEWNWKIGGAVETYDHHYRTIEDSPARIILGFDGDKESLPFSDQLLFETARVLTGHDMPYATLMYVWDRHLPVGTVLPSRRSERVKMMVVANEATGIGNWQTFKRNIVDDYVTAFGEKPGKVIGVGLLTDTDNLGQDVEAWYGDIRLKRRTK